MKKLLYFMLVLMLLPSCYNGKSQEHDALSADTIDDYGIVQRQRDSISFFSKHHYTNNYNFVVSADSLVLFAQQPEELINHLDTDSLVYYRGEDLVVAEIRVIPMDSIDSVWVKLANDQMTFGWTHENDLLPKVAPNDPISLFISTFSDNHVLITLVFVAVIFITYTLRYLSKRRARIVHFNDISSLYPTALVLVVALAATFYSTIQMFGPEIWKHFYYHPTLNPFAVPALLSIFLMLVWLIPMMAIAAVDDIFRHLSPTEGILYLCGLAAVCLTVYIVFSVSTLYYIGYPLLVAYIYFSIKTFYQNRRLVYYCGNCGMAILRKGSCPHCGAINV